VARSWITLRAVAGNLVAVALSGGAKGKEQEDKNMEAFARAWAKQVYNCAGRDCVFTFTDYHALITKLQSTPALDNLGILCHSNGGILELPEPGPDGGPTLVLLSFGQFAMELGSAHQKIKKLEFLGCEVGRDPLAMWHFLQATNIDSAVAHNFYHAFQPVSVTIANGTTADSLMDDLGGDVRGAAFRYLIPGTDLAAVAAKQGKNVQLWVEFFVRDDLSPNLFAKSPGERIKDCRPREDPPGTDPAAAKGPTKELIVTENEAVGVKHRLKQFYPDFTRVEVRK
jgi:hypothetical protein